MQRGEVSSGNSGVKPCKEPPLSSCPTKKSTFSTFSFKNFSNRVNFHPDEKLPCKNSWYCDVKSCHIRNKPILDLPLKVPKCCSQIYDRVCDRQKLNKLEKHGLTRPVRALTSDLEMEETKKCDLEEVFEEIEVVKRSYFPECYEPTYSASEDEEDEAELKSCSSNSISQCSGCSTLGGGIRRKRHEVIKKNWRDLLHAPGVEVCRDSVAGEIKKQKLGHDLTLKLKNVFN